MFIFYRNKLNLLILLFFFNFYVYILIFSFRTDWMLFCLYGFRNKIFNYLDSRGLKGKGKLFKGKVRKS